MEETKDCWIIRSRAKIAEKVYFDRPVTKQEAMDNYEVGEFDDVMDMDVEDILHVISAE